MFLIAFSLGTPTFYCHCAADCDGSGDVTSGDAQGIFLAALALGECADSE